MIQTIVIGGNHHNTLGVIRALGERKIPVLLLIHSANNSSYICASKYVTDYKIFFKLDDIIKYLLASENKQLKKRVIISCSDDVTEQLNLNRHVLDDYYFIPGFSDGKLVSSYMDKTTMISMGNIAGLNSPSTWCLPDDINKVIYPCITKVHVSSHGEKSDIVICNNADQLDSFLRNNKNELFAQAYIDKKEEVQFIGCSLRNGDEVIIPGMSKIIRSQPNTNTGFLEYGPIDSFYNQTVDHAKEYIRDCKYSGLFSIEFLRGKDDRVWFLEINFRNDGNAWCTTKAGINLPVIWVKSCLGEDYASEVKTPKKILMMPEFQDFKLVIQKKLSLIKWLRDLIRTDYFMEYDKKDPKPFWAFLKNKI